MSYPSLRTVVVLCLGITLSLSLSATAQVPTELSYQGRLTDHSGQQEDAPALPRTVAGSVPQLISYQGFLAKANGGPANTGWHIMVFSIYAAENNPVPLWTSTPPNDGVHVNDGSFEHTFGSLVQLPTNLFRSDSTRWLGVVVNGEEMLPRTRLASVPYAFKALHTDTSGFAYALELGTVTTDHIVDGAVTSGKVLDGTLLFADFGQNGATTGQVMTWNGSAWVAADGTGGGSDNDWTLVDNVLFTADRWGIARFGNILHGDADSTHVNLGMASVTGTTGSNYKYATVSGGHNNTAVGAGSFVGGGRSGSADGNFSVIGGGEFNATVGLVATVSGGQENTATGDGATVGGSSDSASGDFSTISGGWFNKATQGYATVGGGTFNSATDWTATVGGGGYNQATKINATVSGGNMNKADGYGAVVAGGDLNAALNHYAAVGGGINDTASGFGATIAGGVVNTASGDSSTVSGGSNNQASGIGATVGGGYINTASGYTATVSGGGVNTAGTAYTTVGGGGHNTANGLYATVGGGHHNLASGQHSTIGGGSSDTASGRFATISGGSNNTASGDCAAIGGGRYNIASGNFATVGGGSRNLASGIGATVGGGLANLADGNYSAISGGVLNSTSGDNASVPGGYLSEANGNFSFAAGRRAHADHITAFVWADHTDADFASTAVDQFLIRARGGVGIGTNNPTEQLNVAGNICYTGSIGACSDARYKKDVSTLQGSLGKLLELRGVNYQWKLDEFPDKKFEEGDQIGFIAQELKELFPEVVRLGSDGFYSVDYGRLTPVLVEAIKELHRTTEELQRKTDEIATLKAKVQTLSETARRIETLEKQRAQLQSLIQQSNAQTPTSPPVSVTMK